MNKGSLAIKEIFDLAVQNHEKNNFTEAQKLYEKILKINSNHLESIFFLGTLSAQIKNFSRAIQLFNKVIEINPNIADVHSNLGLVFKELGEFKKSINCYEQAIKINPNIADVHSNLGLVFKELGEFKKAINCYEQAIKINPNHFASHNNLGVVFKELGEFKKAANSIEQAIKINPNHFASHNNLGNIFKDLGKFEKAISCYEQAIQINPNYIEAHNNLGDIFKDLEEFQKAKICFEKAIQINPNYIEAHNNLGNIFKDLGKFEKAISCYEQAIQINPNYAKAHNNLGLIFLTLGKTQKAISYYEKAIKIEPHFIPAHNNLMEIYERTNNDEKLKQSIASAQSLIKNALTIKLFEGILLYKNEKFSKSISVLESIFFDKKEENYEKLRILNLAKCYDRLEDIDKAFNYFVKVNDLTLQKKIIKSIDKDKYLKKIKIRKNFFKKSKIKQWINFQSSYNRKDPIFIIGFPRSGTTLLDSILRSHPLIDVVEEEPMVEKSIDSLNKLSNDDLGDLKKIDNYQIQKIRKTYFDFLDDHVNEKNNSKFYIDRMPINTIFVGDILRIFPNAKFITLIRHPCDCVLSCFMQDFVPNAQNVNFLNLNDTAHFYEAVMSLWIKYKSIFSFNYHEVKYENLVENFLPTIRSILNFLELPWNDAVLEHTKTAKKRKLITTASYNQVTKPIYSHASGRWKRYKKQISNIYLILEPLIKKFNY